MGKCHLILLYTSFSVSLFFYYRLFLSFKKIRKEKGASYWKNEEISRWKTHTNTNSCLGRMQTSICCFTWKHGSHYTVELFSCFCCLIHLTLHKYIILGATDQWGPGPANQLLTSLLLVFRQVNDHPASLERTKTWGTM